MLYPTLRIPALLKIGVTPTCDASRLCRQSKLLGETEPLSGLISLPSESIRRENASCRPHHLLSPLSFALVTDFFSLLVPIYAPIPSYTARLGTDTDSVHSGRDPQFWWPDAADLLCLHFPSQLQTLNLKN